MCFTMQHFHITCHLFSDNFQDSAGHFIFNYPEMSYFLIYCGSSFQKINLVVSIELSQAPEPQYQGLNICSGPGLHLLLHM